MTSAILAVDYEDMASIAHVFGHQSTRVLQIQQSITQALLPLLHGDWQGASATSFVHEMHSSVLPAIERLAAAMAQAQSTVVQVTQQIQSAELEASWLFVPEAIAAMPAGAAGSPAGVGAGVGAKIDAALEETSDHSTNVVDTIFKVLQDFVRRIRERGSVSEAEARIIFDDMADEPDIPYKFTDDGCYARAHEMVYRIHDRYGIELNDISKVFIAGDLEAATPYRYGYIYLKDGTLVESSTTDGTVNWAWHVAPVIKVRKGDEIIDMVIDPSLADGPITIDEWKQIMNDSDAQLTKTDYKQYTPGYRFENDNQKSLVDQDSNLTIDIYKKECIDEGYCE